MEFWHHSKRCNLFQFQNGCYIMIGTILKLKICFMHIVTKNRTIKTTEKKTLTIRPQSL